MTPTSGTGRVARPADVLPHRGRWLLLADLLEVDEEGLVAVGRPFTAAELEGHYPGDPLVPGALLVELMAQAAGALGAGSVLAGGRTGVLAAVERAVFLRPLGPGRPSRVQARRVAAAPGTLTAACAVSSASGTHCRARLRVVVPGGGTAPSTGVAGTGLASTGAPSTGAPGTGAPGTDAPRTGAPGRGAP